MCIHLLNPPEPACQPTVPGLELTLPFANSICGTCQCVPRFFQLIGVAKPGASAYTNAFMSAILRRDLSSWDTVFPLCQWIASVDLSPFGPPEVGSIVLLAGGGQGPWTLTMNGQNRTAPGVDDREIYSQQAFGFPDSRPWRCLNPNTLYHTGLGSGNFDHMPDSILLQPIWP
jgi:hypothetical protein